MTNLAKMIKLRREALNISQGKLGRALGFVNGQFISNIENSAEIQYPPKYFKKIAKVLKMDMLNLQLMSITDYEIWLRKEIKGA